MLCVTECNTDCNAELRIVTLQVCTATLPVGIGGIWSGIGRFGLDFGVQHVVEIIKNSRRGTVIMGEGGMVGDRYTPQGGGRCGKNNTNATD